MRSRASSGTPGPVSTTRTWVRPPRPLVETRTRPGGGWWRRAFSTTLPSTRSSRPGSAMTTRAAGSRLQSTRSGSVTAATAAGTTSPRSTGRGEATSAPACSRDMSSRLPMRASSRSAESSMAASSSASSSGEKVTSDERRLPIAALMPASGVRRSCETADSSAVRAELSRASAAASPAACCSARRWRMAPACAAKAASSRCRSAGTCTPTRTRSCSSSAVAWLSRPRSECRSARTPGVGVADLDLGDDLRGRVGGRPPHDRPRAGHRTCRRRARAARSSGRWSRAGCGSARPAPRTRAGPRRARSARRALVCTTNATTTATSDEHHQRDGVLRLARS